MRGGCSPRTISSQRQNRPAYKVLYENEATKFRGKKQNPPLSEIALVLVRLDEIARRSTNANHRLLQT